MDSRNNENGPRFERARRLHEEAGRIDASPTRLTALSPSEHDEAGLAYLMDLILTDEAFLDIAPALKRLSTSDAAVVFDLRALSKTVRPFADRLNLAPEALGLMLGFWRQEADKGGRGIEGLDD